MNKFLKSLCKLIPDKLFLSVKYRLKFGRNINWKNPTTYNEKLQWLKLYNRKPEYTVMVDKYLAREYIKEKIGEEYLIPLLGVWDNPDDIDFDKLPDRFVIKCNHNSGTGMYICKDKSKMDAEMVRSGLRRGLKQDYYRGDREWPYKNVPRKIIAEKYMEDSTTGELRDFKFFCFNGEPKMILVCAERFANGLRENFYDTDWNLLPVNRPNNPNTDYEIKKPETFDKMLELANVLAEGIPFSRIDFYEVNGQVYFGEITFFPASGFERFVPEEWDRRLGDWITLEERK